jgi:hypothetical protein
MHPQQKAAWFVLIVFAATVALYSAAVPLVSWRLDRPWTSVAVPFLGLFGLCGLWGVYPLFFMARRGVKLVMDERDRLLSANAWRAGMAIFWLVFVFGCVGSWAFMRYVRGLERVTVPVEFFPWMVIAGMIVFGVTQSVATLCYYGWRSPDAADRH